MTDSVPSTIDQTRLDQLSVYHKPPTYGLQEGSGNACFLDPPGYPSYYTRAVYNAHGNTPSRGPQYTLFGRAVPDVTDLDPVFRSLWVPPPFDSERAQAWAGDLFRHFNRCYRDDEGVAEPPEYGRPAVVVYPVPGYKLRRFVDDPRFSDEWRDQERAAVAAHNAEVEGRYAQVATFDNHVAVRTIRRYYPDAEIPATWLEHPPESTGDWYTTMETRPSPETCPGMVDRWGKYGLRGEPNGHPINGTWCQVCGWHAEETAC